MAKTIANVLVGKARLFLREPNNARAEWSDQQAYAGSYSAKLYKSGSGDAGSTHIEIVPPTGKTVDALVADPTDYSFYYYYSAVTGNFVQFELKYEDPNSDGWMELTVMVHQNTLGTGPSVGWLNKALALTDKIGYGGVNEAGYPFFDYDLGDTIAEAVTGPLGQSAAPVVGDWILTRVRLELWESSPERTAYVDSLEIDGTTYTLEPGGTGPSMSLDSASTEVGYSEEGITCEYTAEHEPLRVDEETFPIGAALTSEDFAISMNMAESSLYNIHKAMAGAALSGSLLTLGAGVNKILNAKITLTNPAGYTRTYLIPACYATGGVSMQSRKNEKTVVPITLHALKTANEPAVTWFDNVA